MDNYIYFRSLDYLAKHGSVPKSHIIVVAGLNWINNPVPFLYGKGFIEPTEGDYKGAEYFQLTEKGKLLYNKMKLFYDTYNDMLSMLSVRKLKERGYNKSVIS